MITDEQLQMSANQDAVCDDLRTKEVIEKSVSTRSFY